MKTLLLFLTISTFAVGQETTVNTGTLISAEKLTSVEQKELFEAQQKIAQANAELSQVQTKIAAAHKMTEQSYMEWSTWYEFDGDYILYRGRSWMQSGTYTINTK